MALRALALWVALWSPACGASDAARSGADAGTGDDASTADAGPNPRDLPCALDAHGPPDPYPWYPALDLARIPFHAGAGDWGDPTPISAPEAPTTTREVTVHTAAELVAAAEVPGTAILVGSDITEQAVLLGDVIDVDIVVPPDRTIADLTVGRFVPPSTVRRVRIRGPEPMSHSGGRVGSLTFASGPTSDVILDGIDMNGEDRMGGGALYYFAGPTDRVAVVNVRGHATGAGSLHADVRDLVIAGSNIYTGARTRTVNGALEGWGMRGGDRVVVFQNYFEGTRYHRVRVHPLADRTQYTWIAENVLVDPYEARIASAMDIGGTPPDTPYDGFWAQCNVLHAHSTCMTPSFDADVATFAELTHNTIHGSLTEEMQTARQAAHPTHDYLTGNVFGAWEPPPAYPLPGDPRDVPLPPDDPADDDPSLEVEPCPGP
jgi:hypothetical protein